MNFIFNIPKHLYKFCIKGQKFLSAVNPMLRIYISLVNTESGY